MKINSMEKNKKSFEEKRSALKDNFLKRLKSIIGEDKDVSIDALFLLASRKAEKKDFNKKYAQLANEYTKEYNAFMNKNKVYWKGDIQPPKPTD